jgi:DUF1365 family protein
VRAPRGTTCSTTARRQLTYGDRHCYLLRAGPDKAFYVSPFFVVDGGYEMTFTDPTVTAASGDGDLRVAVTLRRHGEIVFRASLEGTSDPNAPSFLVGSLRHPAAGRRTIALIRLQGIRLRLKHLPVMPRPVAPVQEGVTVP